MKDIVEMADHHNVQIKTAIRADAAPRPRRS